MESCNFLINDAIIEYRFECIISCLMYTAPKHGAKVTINNLIWTDLIELPFICTYVHRSD